MALPLLVPALLGIAEKIFDRVIPDKAAAEKAKLEMLTALQSQDFQVALAQIEVNKVEAAQPGVFKGGWRPAAGWAAVIVGLVYPAVRVLLPWLLTVAGVEGVPPLPPLDTGEAILVLGSLLGFGGMRMKERIEGKA